MVVGRAVILSMIGILVVSITAWSQSASPPTSQSYRVGIGDVLTIETFEHAEVSGSFVIGEDGAVQFPYLDHVPVVGLTEGEVARLIERQLERDFYVDVSVRVEVKDYRSRPVTILGEVGTPGTIFLQGPTTLTHALVVAGGLKASAGPQVDIRRIERVDGREIERVYSFQTEKVLSGEQGPEFEVITGDIISVSERKLYFITGEINRAGQYELGRGMTLMQAVSQAGGPSKFASNAVEIHRETKGKTEILALDLGDIRRGKVEDVKIFPGDVITLKRRFF